MRLQLLVNRKLLNRKKDHSLAALDNGVRDTKRRTVNYFNFVVFVLFAFGEKSKISVAQVRAVGV